MTTQSGAMKVLLVNPTLDGRSQFQHAAQSISGLEAVHVLESLAEARHRLLGGNIFHAVYLSSLFSVEVLQEFIHRSKGAVGGVDSAYLLTLAETQGSETVEDRYFAELGLDGLLKEPISTSSLTDSIRTAKKVFIQRQSIRQGTAIDVLISGIQKNIDSAASKLSHSLAITEEKSTLRSISKVVRTLPENLKELYFEKLITQFEQATFTAKEKPVPKPQQLQARIIRKK